MNLFSMTGTFTMLPTTSSTFSYIVSSLGSTRVCILHLMNILALCVACSGAQEETWMTTPTHMNESNINSVIEADHIHTDVKDLIVINEIQAQGDPDWIELYNLSDQVLDLSGCWISDDEQDPFKWKLGLNQDVQIEAHGYLMLMIQKEQSGFKLGNQESVILTLDDGSLIDSYHYNSNALTKDTTWARVPDGGRWTTHNATPGESNQSINQFPDQTMISSDADTDTDTNDATDSNANSDSDSDSSSNEGYRQPSYHVTQVLCESHLCNAARYDESSYQLCIDTCLDRKPYLSINEIQIDESYMYVEYYYHGLHQLDVRTFDLHTASGQVLSVVEVQNQDHAPYIHSNQWLTLSYAIDSVDPSTLNHLQLYSALDDSIVAQARWTPATVPPTCSYGRIPDGVGRFYTLVTPSLDVSNGK